MQEKRYAFLVNLVNRRAFRLLLRVAYVISMLQFTCSKVEAFNNGRQNPR